MGHTANLGQPVQKLPMSRKGEKWRKDNVNYFIGLSGMSSSTNLPSDDELYILYDLYNGEYDKNDLKYITNPFNQEDGFPASAENYNIIRSYIDSLVGEESKQPFNFRVSRTSDIAGGEVMEKGKQMIMDWMQAYIMSKMGEEEAARYQEGLQSGEIQTPEQIATYLTKDYKDMMEITAYHSLRYLKRKLNVDHEFIKGMFHALVGGLEYYYVGVKNGEPCHESINSIGFKWGASDNIEFVDEADWCVREMLMSPSQIYDQLYDKMNEKDLNSLLDLIEHKAGQLGSGKDRSKLDNWNPIKTRLYSDIPSHNPFVNYVDELLVWHVCWRSYKKIGFVTIVDIDSGVAEEFQVDENYQPTGLEENIEWKWIVEIWEGYKVGEDLYLGMQPIDYQYYNLQLNAQRLPYTGAAYSNVNSKSKSLLSIMKPLQYMYIILWYKMELFISRDNGKVLSVDVNQIPVSLGTDVPKWMHYLKTLGVNFYNPYEEGWKDADTQQNNHPTGYTGMKGEDLSQSQAIVDYIRLMDKIENMLRTITGINAERQGEAQANSLVGVVERNVRQSTNVTAPIFWMHNQIKGRVLSMLLNTAKSVWKNNDKQYLNYILDDGTRAFLQLSDDFAYEDFDIFVTDSAQESAIIEQIKQLVQPAMQNGASLMDVIDILTIDDIAMLKHKMEEIEINRQQREQAMIEQQQQADQQIQEMKNEVEDRKLMMQEAELDLKKYEIDVKAETSIITATLNAYRGKADLDQDMNGVPDPMEIMDRTLKERQITAEESNKEREADQKNRELKFKQDTENKKLQRQKESDKVKADIEKRRNDVEKQKMANELKLQKMKDSAAMARERLKAKTVLANKVVGEK